MEWSLRLIWIYLKICNLYPIVLRRFCPRQSNNHGPVFTDQEVLCVYLFGYTQGYSELRRIHNFASNHLKPWFPDLPSYAAFVHRVNLICDAFPMLFDLLVKDLCPNNDGGLWLVDSMPVIMAASTRSSTAKVAPHLASKGYCSSKKLYYYGVKLHILGLRRKGALPVPGFASMTSANVHDLAALKEVLPYFPKGTICGDKAYMDSELEKKCSEAGLKLFVGQRKKKGAKFVNARLNLLNTAVSQTRQSIESLFNWLTQKTDIQRASKVRSEKGLKVHVFGRLTAACLLLLNP